MTKKHINDMYEAFIPEKKDKFIKEIKLITSKVNLKDLTDLPILVYSKGKRHAFYFALCATLAMEKNTLLSYAVISSRSFLDQSFRSDEYRDQDLLDKVYYGDITFVNVNSFDYSNRYLGEMLVDLVEFRENQNRDKITVIFYDTFGDTSKNTVANKTLHTYFVERDLQIIDLINSKDSVVLDTSKPEEKLIKSKEVLRRGGGDYN